MGMGYGYQNAFFSLVILVGALFLASPEARAGGKPRQPLSRSGRPVNKVRIILQARKGRAPTTLLATFAKKGTGLRVFGGGVSQDKKRGQGPNGQMWHLYGKLGFSTLVDKHGVVVDIPAANFSVRSTMLMTGLKSTIFETVPSKAWRPPLARRLLPKLKLTASARQSAIEKANLNAIRARLFKSPILRGVDAADIAGSVTSQKPGRYKSGRSSLRIDSARELELGYDFHYDNVMSFGFQDSGEKYNLMVELDDSGLEEPDEAIDSDLFE